MLKINKVKFFLVAATLIGGMSSATAEDFDWGGDPNGDIGVPGTSVVDNAVENPILVNCHDCEIVNRNSNPLNPLFEARGAAAAKGSGSAQDAKQ